MPEDIISEQGWQSLVRELRSKHERSPDRKELNTWALVLEARRIPFRHSPAGTPADLLVPAAFLQQACHEIELYRRENMRTEASVEPSLVAADNVLTSLSVLLLLGIFHNATYLQVPGFGHQAIDWLRAGSAHNDSILAGQWWRIVTALTLHADAQHLLGNILIGGYFVVRLCQMTGSGLGWLLILASGAGGNFLNAVFQPTGHDAVGASTAIFGAIGIAGAIASALAQSHRLRRWLIPLAASGGLLAFLGAGGGDAHVDVGAHLFGFLCGVLCGWPAGYLLHRKGSPGRLLNALTGATAAAIVLVSWWLALAHS